MQRQVRMVGGVSRSVADLCFSKMDEEQKLIGSNEASFVALSEADGAALLQQLAALPVADPRGRLKTFGELSWQQHDVVVAWLRHFA